MSHGGLNHVFILISTIKKVDSGLSFLSPTHSEMTLSLLELSLEVIF